MNIYLDIETIPSQREDVRAMIADKVTPPAAMKKAETIAAWERDQKGEAVEEAWLKTSLDGTFGQIVCIGYAIDGGMVSTISGDPFAEGDERKILQRFFASLPEHSQDGRPRTFIGHNLANFDIRYIWQRAVINGVKTPYWWPHEAKPWDDVLFDTMTKWAGPRGFVSMDKLCLAFGVTGKPDDIDGSRVWEYVREGKIQKVADYCAGDVERARIIHKRMTFSA
jgi:predicted PolB exonuclease-like 3'-5' exonuclease